ncbi:MAG: filamentous hemagglutinin N-terminal domain-containing protein [Nitrospira sp.]|nr:filamentous hemagglutinin N-terminal domain-containing protein [Nitrospira sp.]
MSQQSYKYFRYTAMSILFLFNMCLTDSWFHEAEAENPIAPTQSPPFEGQDLRLGTSVEHNGNTTSITGGTHAGPNLFHSFETFGINATGVAQFINRGSIQDPNADPLPITDIFARVTGNIPSNIDGMIKTTGPTGFNNANFWLMNPNGITFGSGAQLDIGGSAIFTTARTLTFSDSDISDEISINRTFEANNQSSPLSIASVISFGFFPTQQPSTITVTGSNLSVSPGQTLSLVGRDITISGGHLQAPDGAVRVTSVGLGPNGSLVNIDDDDSSHSINPTTAAQSITVDQAANGKDAVIDTGSNGQIQLNGVTYTGSSSTGSNITNPTSPIIVIQNGSLLVANLPPAKLIVSSPAVRSLAPNPSLVDIGGAGNLVVTLNHAFTNSVPVSFTSKNPGVALVAPVNVVVPAGQNSTPVQVQGVAPGLASVQAAVGNTTTEATVRVGFPQSGTSDEGGHPVNNPTSPPPLTDPTTVITAPIPSPHQLVMASARCSASEKGSFSSFVPPGRDTARPQPGGLLASPPFFEDDIPHISPISVRPTVRGTSSLHLASGTITFLARSDGC